MQLPQVRLESQFAQINIMRTPGRQEISQPKAELSIQQPKADLSISVTPGKLSIDQTQAWEDMNLHSPLRSAQVAAQEGASGLLEGMQRRTQQGAELMEIENGGDPIVNQSIVNGHDQMKSLGLKYIPSHLAVKISYQPSSVNIDAQVNRPIIDVKTNRPEHSYRPGSVVIQMEKYNSLEIDIENLYSSTV